MWRVTLWNDREEAWETEHGLPPVILSFDRPVWINPEQFAGLYFARPWMRERHGRPVETFIGASPSGEISLDGSVLRAQIFAFQDRGQGEPLITTLNADGECCAGSQPEVLPYDDIDPDEEAERVFFDDSPEDSATALIDVPLAHGESAAVAGWMLLTWLDDAPAFRGDDDDVRALCQERTTLASALGRYADLSRVVARQPDLDRWVYDLLLRIPDVQTALFLAENPSLPADHYPLMAALFFDAWLKNPALPLYAMTDPSPAFLPHEQAERRWNQVVQP